jgi:hypothetical protein
MSFTFRIYNALSNASNAESLMCLITGLAAGWCYAMVTYIFDNYVRPWVVYAVNNYHQCLYVRVPAPPLGPYYFLFVGSVKSITCPAGMG